jgi:prolyl 4-hydroxylase
MRFFCVTRPDIEATNALLRQACEARGIAYIEINPDTFRYADAIRPQPGDLVYRVATDLAAVRLEDFLTGEGVATFATLPHFDCYNQLNTLAQAGVPVPRTVFALTRDRELLADHVAYLGGFPVVLKVLGGEGGAGVMRADSYPSLFSLADYLPPSTLMMEYVEHAVAYRLVVVGERVVATEARYPGPEEFRTNTWNSDSLGKVDPPKEAVRMALAAARALKTEFGGADVLENEAGRMVMTEFNTPCYFADQQNEGGVDIAGAMLDHLIAKAGRLAAQPAFAAGEVDLESRLDRAWPGLRQLSARPAIYVVDDFASDGEIAQVLATAEDEEALRARGIDTKRDATGFSFEAPVRGHAALEALAARTYRLLGVANALGETLRFRRYQRGESHPPHEDAYWIDGNVLAVTAMLYLTDTRRGGETYFPNAEPAPVGVEPRKGRLAIWYNVAADGCVDKLSAHEGRPVKAGTKATITNFVYRPTAGRTGAR